MTGRVKALAAFFGSLVAAYASAQPPQIPADSPPATPRTGSQLPASPPKPPAVMPAQPTPPTAGPSPVRVALAEVVDPAFRDAVIGVVRKPTIASRGTAGGLVCPQALLDWLLAHPDRVALAWRRMGVPCVEISDPGNGRFAWADGEGSELAWQKVGQFPDGLVWYATGKVKAAVVAPTVPVRAVVVMTYPKKPAKDGTPTILPAAQVYLQTDSKAAVLVMRMLGPTAPKLAQDGADQLVLFFAGVAQYVQNHPEKADELLAPPKK